MRSPRRRRVLAACHRAMGPRGLLRPWAVARGAAEQKHFAADGASAALMPANTSLAKLLASHVLRDGEIVLLILRPSLWFIFLTSLRFIAAALALIVAVRLLSTASHSAMRSVIELDVSAISVRLTWAVLQWMSRLYILTDLRVLSVSGVFRVAIFDCPLRKTARTRLVRTNEDRATGVGSIEIIPIDESTAFGLWQTISHPHQVHEQMVATINRTKQCGL